MLRAERAGVVVAPERAGVMVASERAGAGLLAEPAGAGFPAEGTVRVERAVDAGEAVAGRRLRLGRTLGGRRERTGGEGRRLRRELVGPTVRAGGRGGLLGGAVGGRRVEAGRHLEAAGRRADGRDLHGRRGGGRQPGLRPARPAAGRRLVRGGPGRPGLGLGRPGLRARRLLGRGCGPLRGHHQPVASRVAALLAEHAGRGAHRRLPAGRRLVGGTDAVDVVTVGPGGRLGPERRAGQRRGQVSVSG
ncbi:hypothetical protein ACWENR_19860 [Micromonospora sp. NPDC004336]